MRSTWVINGLYAVLMAFQCSVVFATETAGQDPAPAVLNDPNAELNAAFQAAGSVLMRGPTDVPIAEQAVLKLPEGYGYVPTNEARRLLQAMGNRPSDGLQGMIFPTANADANWFVVVSYANAGYIKDDDAKDWDSDELLDSIRAGTDETNEERRSRGIPEMEVVGWVERPQYDTAAHRLVWSIESRDKGQPAGETNGINYNSLALGREGFMSMNLVTDVQAVEALKPVAGTLLAGLDFNAGKRYADFNAGTDKVAEYGLAALVAGVAAKKLGLFAVIAAFFIKFGKLIAVAVAVGLGGLGKKLLRRNEMSA